MRLFLNVILIFFFLLFLLPNTVSAQEWVIQSYQSDIEILENGVVSVVETIEADFGTLEKHGIYRDIPYIYEGEGDSVYTDITVLDVLQDSHSATYETFKDNGYLRIKIGDADRTLSGVHTYIISYTVLGVLRGFGTYDEFYWNVIGPYWEVPIRDVSAQVTLPSDGIIQTSCYVGNVGSDESCSFETESSSSALFRSRDLDPYEAFTVAVGYKKGLVPLITVEKPKTFFEKFIEPASLVTFVLSVFIGIGAVFVLWYKNGRDFWHGDGGSTSPYSTKVKPLGAHETVVVEYEPPEKLRPAEIGVLVDERAHTHDVTATIVDLAVRGYVSITEIPKKWMFGKSDYKLLLKREDTSKLADYESLLIQHLFGSKKEVLISSLKMTFYKKLTEVKSKLYEDVISKNLFDRNPESVRSHFVLIGILVLVCFGGLTVLGLVQELVYLFDFGIGGTVCGVLLLIYSQFMPRRTAKGRELYRRVRGYQHFISTVEKHRQKFFEKKNLFNEVLPYAIVFELTSKYIKAMDDMGIKPSSVSWYHGTRPFSMNHFASSMSNLSSSVSQSMSQAPKSSGSSGGGSSGGGFGGGGGGSW